MENNRLWLIIVGLTFITVITRSLFLLAGSSITISPTIQRALRFAPAATLIALILPSLVAANNSLTMASINPLNNFKLAASIVAGIVFFYTRHMMLMIIVGMGLYAALRFFAV